MVNTAAEPQAISFPGMDPTEEFRFYFYRHWTRVARSIGFMLLWVIMLAALVYVSGVASADDLPSRRMLIGVFVMFFLVPQFVFAMKMYKYFLCMVIVTDKKVHYFRRTILAVDTHQSIDLWVLQDIDKTQRGLIQNMLGFGTLRLEAQNTALLIYFVPQIDKIYDVIVGLREEARNKTLPQPPQG